MRLLVTGANGQVGWELARSLMPLGEVIAVDRARCDLSRPDTIAALIQDIRPDVVVNAAAYTAVDKAEQEEALATVINGTAVGVLAQEARKANALLIHYSTDYVFDGSKDKPYVEDDVPNPVNAYGRSKLAGEIAIRQAACDYLILRTTWVYAARGNNFVKTILRLARERDELSIVADQFGAPTWARNIADATAHMIRQASLERRAEQFTSGIFNLTNSGKTTWHGFAQAIVAAQSPASLKLTKLNPIPTTAYPLPAKRPANSCLDAGEFGKRFGLVMPSWEMHWPAA
ncbi:dTDP-4-dehydrorhamnose reductase [Undibacterium arcticum]|uniref:dTDP-4-dehydrorhamnose reductase n=1 Tax=Undibacterium arcticum TaxID=1762892 RepID=UPI00360D2127